MDLKTLRFADSAPYPAPETDGHNPRYATAILSNIGAVNSEMSAVSLYFYNSLITKKFFPDIAQCFHHISIVEMHHMNLFGELALNLGTDPRLWSYNRGHMNYWSPSSNRYPSNIAALVSNSLSGEQDAIRKYQAQISWIEDENIKALLKRIIADEEIHVSIFKSILTELGVTMQVQELDDPPTEIPSE
jgi:bacterioferritin